MLHFRPKTGIIKLHTPAGPESKMYPPGHQILAILEDVAEIAPEDVREDSVLMDDLDLSSMEILTIVADLEETFGLRIPEKELRNFVTISDVADYLADNAG